MKKISFFVLILIISAGFLPAEAKKIPVRIAPTQIISTNHNEIEVGDWICFEIVNDVYDDNQLYIKKGTKVIGIVDFLHPNGWLGDAADIKFNKFMTVNSSGKKIEIYSPLNLNGNILLKNESKQLLSYFLTALIRGSEIFIEPDTKNFNIFINQ